MLSELVTRIEAATNAYDAPHSHEVLVALGFEVARHVRGWHIRYPGGRWESLPRVTHETDDALRMIERVLPGWELEINSEHRDEAAIWRVKLGDPLRGFDGEAPTPALALCAAALRALQTAQKGTADAVR